MSYENLTPQQIKSLIALRKDLAMDLAKELTELLNEIATLEKLVDNNA